MKLAAIYRTGSRRGYIPVLIRGVESTPRPVPVSLNGYGGNMKKALEEFRNLGCTHFTVCNKQGVPGKGYSNRYCYTVYYGYVEEVQLL